MLTAHPAPSRPSATAVRARQPFDTGLAIVLGLVAALVAVPTLIAITGVGVGLAAPVVVSIVSILGMYAVFATVES